MVRRSSLGLGRVIGSLAFVAATACVLSIDETKLDPVTPGSDSSTPLVDGSTHLPDGKCQFAGDCPPVTTSFPADCAEAICNGGNCAYVAKDKDGDHHRAATCTAPGLTITTEDDCDDSDSAMYPGGPGVECAENEDDKPISFPGGNPKGSCKRGKRTCNSDGTKSKCVGAVGPAPETTCTPALDENCDGNPFDACTCTTGQTQACGSSNTAPCKQGVTTCQGDGTYGPCVGNIEPKPRDCGSGVDNDCNGAVDSSEAVCQCPGGVPPNTVQACNGHAEDGIGLCHAGTRTCAPSGGSSSFGGCTGDVGPSSEVCDGADRNCNGTAGINEQIALVNGVCLHLYQCPAADRGEICFRTDLGGYSFYCSTASKTTTGYAQIRSFSGSPNPAPAANEFRICNSADGQRLGLFGQATSCVASCPSANIFLALGQSSSQLYSAYP